MTEPDAYLYMAAHDLRAPLMSVKGLLMLMRQDSEKENVDHYFALMEKSIDKMDKSISNIITYSKAEDEQIKPQAVEVDSIINDSVLSLQYMARAESIQIDIQTEKGGIFFSDHTLLFSVFSNIVSNAIRYRDVRKVSFLRIDVSYPRGGCRVVFKDNGIGIEEGLLGKIFDKFFYISDDREGTGIGLYAVKSSLEKLGGSIDVESQIDEGTTFILHLPNLLAQSDHS